MLTKEDVLKLTAEEKTELIHSIEENLGKEKDVLSEKLPDEIIIELKRREKMIETGEAKWIDEQELLDFLRQRGSVH